MNQHVIVSIDHRFSSERVKRHQHIGVVPGGHVQFLPRRHHRLLPNGVVHRTIHVSSAVPRRMPRSTSFTQSNLLDEAINRRRQLQRSQWGWHRWVACGSLGCDLTRPLRPSPLWKEVQNAAVKIQRALKSFIQSSIKYLNQPQKNNHWPITVYAMLFYHIY